MYGLKRLRKKGKEEENLPDGIPPGAKAHFLSASYGTTEVVPCYKTSASEAGAREGWGAQRIPGLKSETWGTRRERDGAWGCYARGLAEASSALSLAMTWKASAM